ncbi:UDP-N-acetylglucosamine--N-acetylmuramyl-(pentapeptide) pyrophosphoryl-undecaprenol N-acetylglucosamine transferase [Acidianus brierleyi]|uniref:Polysaccharide biosynthesis protein n=1 Tax=Acidianus brierleyi TaxID=41673 RepID=A0A2U9IGN7_9CREN|nr:glycosyltransferase [Acidianus brierleyi]AWR95094.1 polysaccharide biosynthesis protein [Acidianus brierleyi]
MADILIIASGGGHTGFARAVAENIERKVDFVIPKGDEISKKMLNQYASKFYEVEKGRGPFDNSFSSLLKFLRAMVESSKIRKYDIILATGSNHSIFPSFFQYIKGAKVFAIESQDRIITKGKAINIISKYSKAVFLHWKEQKSLYKKGIVVGPIVENPHYNPSDNGYILVTAGTEGFPRLFEKISTINLKNVIIQTGKIDPNLYSNKVLKAFNFDPDLEKYIANSSLIITHQGKTAMEAVVMYKKPTIIVYNKTLVRAATREDTRLYAKILGAMFLDDPLDWKSNDELLYYIENPRKPNYFTSGAHELVKVMLNEYN